MSFIDFSNLVSSIINRFTYSSGTIEQLETRSVYTIYLLWEDYITRFISNAGLFAVANANDYPQLAIVNNEHLSFAKDLNIF